MEMLVNKEYRVDKAVLLTVVEDPVHVSFISLQLDGESSRISGTILFSGC
jgi:hypothetical protein